MAGRQFRPGVADDGAGAAATMTRIPTVLVAALCLSLLVAGATAGVAGAAPPALPGSGDVEAVATSVPVQPDLTPEPTGALSVANDHLVLYVDEDGLFTLQTEAGGENADLLYGTGTPSTSYLSVAVDDTVYTTTGFVGTPMSPYVTGPSTATDDTIVTEWTLPEGVVVTQTIELDDELAVFTVDVVNADGTPHEVNVRYLFDYQVRYQDGSPVWLNGAVITNEATFDAPTPTSWKTYDAVPEPSLVGQATDVAPETAPDRVQFAYWLDAFYTSYDYTTHPAIEFFDVESSVGDSAGLLYWEFGPLGVDQSAKAQTAYGVGTVEDASETLNLNFEDQSSDGTSVVVDTVFLPEEGFLAVYDADDTLLGTSDLLPVGSSAAVPVSLTPTLATSQELTVVPFRDDGDGTPDAADDGAFTAAGQTVGETAFVTVGSGPTADAGVAESVSEGDAVGLDGTGSSDLDGDALSYAWTQTGGPTVSLTGADTATPTFVTPLVDVPTPLTFELTVSDAAGNADTDTVVVTVTDVPAPDPEATVSFADQESDGTTVVVDEVFLSEGGFVTVHDATLATDPFSSVVGVSDHLDPGTHEDVVVTLFDVPGLTFDPAALTESQTLVAMPHLDSDGDGSYDFVTTGGDDDGPYLGTDGPVTDAASVTVTGTLYWQLDLVAGQPYDALGPNSGNDFYADSEEDRLFRYAHGNSEEGITERGSAWPSSDLRACVDPRHLVDGGDGTVSVEFTVADDCADVTLTLAAYEKPGPGFDRSMNQTLLAAETGVFGPGTHTLTLDLPAGAIPEEETA
jgi:hypothetical protein